LTHKLTGQLQGKKHSTYNIITTAMGTDKFCLRWNDFESNISTAFRELRDDKDFFDVTLACDDEQIQVHKVIISACSPFFRNVLRRNSHQHPLLYLKDVKFTDLQAVLNFMYHGEVNVAQEDLNSFLAVAEDLKVKGLTQTNSNRGKTRSAKNNSLPSSETVVKDTKQSQPNPPISDENHILIQSKEAEEIQEVISIKSEPKDAIYSHYKDNHRATTTALPPSAAIHIANDQSVATYHKETLAYPKAVTTTHDQAMTPYQEEYEQYEEEQQYQAADQSVQMQGKGNR
jgi:hypothetical protein